MSVRMSVIRYKLTDKDGKTRNNTYWGPGVKYATSGIPASLCTEGWLHCYDDPFVAVFMNPIHANFTDPKMCEVECSGKQLTENGLKEGWTEMSFVRWVDCPTPTTTQRVAFGILCAKKLCKDQAWNAWADSWLNNIDRSATAAYAAYAAYGAAYAAYGAAYGAAYTAADAADAAYTAASVAASAAAISTLDLPALARKAMEY